MGFFRKGIQSVENLKNIKTNNIKMVSLNGYDAIRERLDEHNTLTVKQPVVVNEKPKPKASIGFN